MHRFTKSIMASLMALPYLLFADTASEEAAKTIINAIYNNDIETLNKNSTGGSRQSTIDGAERAKAVTGAFKGVSKVQIIEYPSAPTKNAKVELDFENGKRYGIVILNNENKFAGIQILPVMPQDAAVPEISFKQMLEDYDYMTKTLLEIMPHTPVIREAYNIDAVAKLAEYRSQITPETRIDDFYLIMKNALNACKGHHLGIANPRMLTNEILRAAYKDKFTDNDVAVFTNILWLCDSKLDRFKSNIPDFLLFEYVDGKYYTSIPVTIGETIVPLFSELISFNSKTPSELENELQDKLNFFDARRKKFYFPRLLSYVKDYDNNPVIHFRSADGKDIKVSFDENTKSNIDFSARLRSEKKVLFLPESNTIYVCIPVMNPNDTDFYISEIDKIYAEHSPETAIIDIRNNPGGSDFTGLAVAKKLSKKPIRFSSRTAFKATERIENHMRAIGADLSKYHKQTIPFLEAGEYYVSPSSENNTEAGTGTADNIYVLVKDIFSAAGTLAMVAGSNEHMKTLGFENPMMLGRGIDPYMFCLPNSKFFLTVEPVIDISNCKKASDVLHGSVEIPLVITSEEYIKYLSRKAPADAEGMKKYLVEYDPFVRKALEDSKDKKSSASNN